MALLPALATPSNPKFRIKLFPDLPFRLQKCSVLHFPHQTCRTRTYSVKVSMADQNEPKEVEMQIRAIGEKLRGAIPISVKKFPWKKAKDMILHRLLFLTREALKWSLISFFIFGSLSDVVYTFSINRELIIPVGLFVGCISADFLKEILQEVFHCSEEKDLNRHLLGMYCFFVFIKFISTNFVVPAKLFLLHVANGGLMQVLWYWRSIMKDAKDGEEGSSSSGLEAS
ncbi:hypothetical protein L6164_024542 [Bauhinia variegata]|uniref:Uncharacterized protein n=1 Tax=Bauhinia variegata TaxID=167791 RepID=A0ACB9LZ28_BAUVA|nr:hypothetical protein L6164_024542 [Bauhinia variegata]